jgi:hypothetical protein
MKYLLILLIDSVACLTCIAQTNSPAVIITSGTHTAGEDASLSWTIGESLIESFGKEDLLLLQGFQEVEDFTAAIPDDSFDDAGVLVFPTKTPDVVHVVISGSYTETLKGEFIDMSGRLVLHVRLDALHNEINLADFSYGIYLLRISSGDKQVTETKIIRDKSPEP